MPDTDKHHVSLSRNFISQIAAAITIVALANLAFLIYLDSTQAHSGAYFGILTWVVAPVILIF